MRTDRANQLRARALGVAEIGRVYRRHDTREDDNAATGSKENPMTTKFMVIVEGSIVQDVLANDGTLPDWHRHDWDDFRDNPVQYWNDMGAEWQEFFKQVAPLAYAEALAMVDEEKRLDEEERKSIPFIDVPDPSKGGR